MSCKRKIKPWFFFLPFETSVISVWMFINSISVEQSETIYLIVTITAFTDKKQQNRKVRTREITKAQKWNWRIIAGFKCPFIFNKLASLHSYSVQCAEHCTLMQKFYRTVHCMYVCVCMISFFNCYAYATLFLSVHLHVRYEYMSSLWNIVNVFPFFSSYYLQRFSHFVDV